MTYPVEPEPWPVDPRPWAPLIGRLFIAFGYIEKTTHDCICEWAGETIYKYVARFRFSDRLDLAADLAESRDATQTVKQQFKEALLKARELAKHRNLLAHNPLCLVFLQDGTDLEAIANIDGDRHMSLGELEELVHAAERCSEDLLDRFVAFRVAKLDFEFLKSFPGLRGTGVT